MDLSARPAMAARAGRSCVMRRTYLPYEELYIGCYRYHPIV